MLNPHENPSSEKKTSVQLLEELETVYAKREKGAEFQEEKETYAKLLPQLIEHLGDAYTLVEPKAIGSTATVWIVYDAKLNQRRALKLARPRFYKLDKIIFVLRGESDLLAKLSHQNIIKIYGSDEIKLKLENKDYRFPYFVMEYFDQIDDLDDYILKNLGNLRAEDIIEIFRDLLSGLAFIHERGIIHCDVKPGNLLIAPDRRALVADLGYAKALRIPSEEYKLTYVSYTPPYAHPKLGNHMIDDKDSAANIAHIPSDHLDKTFDLFAFGRSMQEVLKKIYDSERADPSHEYGRRSIFTPYQWSYLGYISKRLLDGVVQRSVGTELEVDIIPGLSESVMSEIKYLNVEDSIADFEKLLHLYDLEGDIPELNPNLSSFIQIPHCRVPLTPRVEKIINHPIFARLAQVTQLGFVSLIYPGASHSRFEHVLGTFAHCCDFIRALWYDQANGLFQSVMSSRDLELGMLAALLHDIGQYPMAHDFTEISPMFAHESLTLAALYASAGTTDETTANETLADVLAYEWGIEAEEILSIINANEDSLFRHRVLKSLISGPLDCDKLDYLKRDATHLGVSFGGAIDDQRLLRNLTIAYDTKDDMEDREGLRVQIKKLDYAEIGVTEKALVVAQSLWRVRKDMFTQVYWQHTARALKAMLGYVVRNIVRRLDTQSKAVFWSEFRTFVLFPVLFSSDGSIDGPEKTEDREKALLTFSDKEPGLSNLVHTHLSATDNAALNFLSRFAGEREKKMIQAIRTRKVYQRYAVLSETLEKTIYNEVYDQFRFTREDLNAIEENRETWEARIIDEALTEMSTKSYLIPPGLDIDGLERLFKASKPILLVDVPIKGSGRDSAPETIPYLPEDLTGVHSRQMGSFPKFERKRIDLEQMSFDKEVGKIRILAHPGFRDILVRSVSSSTAYRFLK